MYLRYFNIIFPSEKLGMDSQALKHFGKTSFER